MRHTGERGGWESSDLAFWEHSPKTNEEPWTHRMCDHVGNDSKVITPEAIAEAVEYVLGILDDLW